MRVLITGGAGLVAGHLLRSAPSDADVHVTWRRTPARHGVHAHQLDLADSSAVQSLFDSVQPEAVVHTAYSQSSRADVVDASVNVAEAAAACGARLVHLSSDMVFGGDSAPYDETAVPAPVNDYGTWKLEAERLVLEHVPGAVLTRTSLVVSSDPLDHQAAWLSRALGAGESVTLFHDEYRTPVRADDLATILWDLAMGREAGVIHVAGPERLSRADIGLRCAADLGLAADLVQAASAANHPEPRPRDLSLASIRLPNSATRPIGW